MEKEGEKKIIFNTQNFTPYMALMMDGKFSSITYILSRLAATKQPINTC